MVAFRQKNIKSQSVLNFKGNKGLTKTSLLLTIFAGKSYIMNSWAIYHSHTWFCDGAEPPEPYIKEAIKLGLSAYGYSSHAPVPFASGWNMADEKLPEYLKSVNEVKEKYSQQIQVYTGMEIDYIPGIAGRSKHLMKNTALDYFIGSIHYLGRLSSGEYWNIDTSQELFVTGLKELFNNDIRKAVTLFWEITRQMIEEDRPDIIGHMDKIKMFNKRGLFFDENESWYRDQVELTLAIIKQKGCIVEINTRGFYRYNRPDLYPGEQIIRQLAKLDIPVLISSDAHKPEEILLGMLYTVPILKQSGIKKLAALYNGHWNEYEYSEKGYSF